MAKKEKVVNVFSGIENYEKFSIRELAGGAIDELIKLREPVILHGGTGIGKTQVCEQIARRLGMTFKYTQPAAFESVDFAGMPQIDKEKNIVRFIISEMLAFDPSQSYLWLIDELNRAMPDVRQVLLGLFNQPGFIGSHKLPENVSIIVAVNSASIQSGVNVAEAESAQISRCANIYAYTTLSDTCDYLSEKYSNNFFVKFLSSDFAKKIISSDFSSEWEKSADEVLLVPRILEKAAKVCHGKSLEQVKQSLRLVGAFVGAQAKLAFAEFLAECESLDAEVFFDAQAIELSKFLQRDKNSENVSLLNTAGANAVSMLTQKKQSEQVTFFRNLMALRSNGWGEVLAAILLRVKELNDTSIHKLLTQSDLADFLIDYQLSAKAKAQAKN
jgi:MoxR-like ATPase